jgi:hypothetical protein
MINFPEGLPSFILRDGYDESLISKKVSFETESGPAMERLQSTTVTSLFSVQWLFDEDQLSLFEEFVIRDLSLGSKVFVMKHPRKAEFAKFRFQGNTPYKLKNIGWKYWVVSAELLGLPE